MENLPFIYKRLDDSSLADVQYLFLTVFNKKKSINYLKNKYNTSYLGIKYICYIAYHDSKPVAFYGAIPQKFSSNSSSILVAHACDSFTLNEYQKKGLHYNLALKSYEVMKTEGIQFVYAYHSENTYFSTKKLGWLEYKKMQRFHFKTTTLPLAKLTKKLSLEKTYSIFCNAILEKYSILNVEEVDFSSKKMMQYNQEDFINYKNGFNTHLLIAFYDCTFWIKIDAILHVGFFTSSNEENFKKALLKLKKTASLIGISEILFQVLIDSKEYQLLSKIETPKESWLLGYLPFETVNLDDLEFNYADLDTF